MIKDKSRRDLGAKWIDGTEFPTYIEAVRALLELQANNPSEFNRVMSSYNPEYTNKSTYTGIEEIRSANGTSLGYGFLGSDKLYKDYVSAGKAVVQHNNSQKSTTAQRSQNKTKGTIESAAGLRYIGPYVYTSDNKKFMSRSLADAHQRELNEENARVAEIVKNFPSPSFQDINIFGTPNGGVDLFSYVPQDYVSAPVAQAAASASSDTSQASVKPSGRASGSAGSSIGRMATSSGETINYRRDINGKEWEAAEPYQNFLSYMRGKGADDKEVKEWMDYIQNAIKESGSKYKLKDFDDWSRLAEDGKVGPVHQATLKAAEYFAKRRGLTAVDPNGLNPTIGDILGVKPETARGISENSAPQSPQTPSGSTDVTTSSSPRFNYRDTYLRYAPAIGSSMAALYGMLNRPDYSNADRVIDAAYRLGTPVNIPVETIGDYRRRNPYDERYLVNMANQNRLAAARGIANTAGGNRAMDLLGNMSLAHNNQQELGEIMRQAYLANRQDDAQVAEFNRGTNVYNMNAINQRNLSQAQLNSHRQQASLSGLAQGYGMRQAIKDNWDASTMQSLNSTLASLGAIGKENEEYNILMSMAENGYFPYYYGDRSIIKFNPYTGEKLVKNGGKLNRKKRRF